MKTPNPPEASAAAEEIAAAQPDLEQARYVLCGLLGELASRNERDSFEERAAQMLHLIAAAGGPAAAAARFALKRAAAKVRLRQTADRYRLYLLDPPIQNSGADLERVALEAARRSDEAGLLEALARGEQDVAAGRTRDADEVQARVRERVAERAGDPAATRADQPEPSEIQVAPAQDILGGMGAAAYNLHDQMEHLLFSTGPSSAATKALKEVDPEFLRTSLACFAIGQRLNNLEAARDFPMWARRCLKQVREEDIRTFLSQPEVKPLREAAEKTALEACLGGHAPWKAGLPPSGFRDWYPWQYIAPDGTRGIITFCGNAFRCWGLSGGWQPVDGLLNACKFKSAGLLLTGPEFVLPEALNFYQQVAAEERSIAASGRCPTCGSPLHETLGHQGAMGTLVSWECSADPGHFSAIIKEDSHV